MLEQWRLCSGDFRAVSLHSYPSPSISLAITNERENSACKFNHIKINHVLSSVNAFGQKFRISSYGLHIQTQ